jgi:hypothetical protein
MQAYTLLSQVRATVLHRTAPVSLSRTARILLTLRMRKQIPSVTKEAIATIMQTIESTNTVANVEPTLPHADPRLNVLERRLVEAFDELWDSFVDPAEATCDIDGTPWSRLGGNYYSNAGTAGMPFADEHQLAAIRDQCRSLAVANEFAINGHDYPLP